MFEPDRPSYQSELGAVTPTNGRNLAEHVSCNEPYEWDDEYDASYPDRLEKVTGRGLARVLRTFCTSKLSQAARN